MSLKAFNLLQIYVIYYSTCLEAQPGARRALDLTPIKPKSSAATMAKERLERAKKRAAKSSVS